MNDSIVQAYLQTFIVENFLVSMYPPRIFLDDSVGISNNSSLFLVYIMKRSSICGLQVQWFELDDDGSVNVCVS